MSNAEVYQMVTDRIVAEMEAGRIPWRQGWHGGHNGAYNRVSLKPYSILNQMMLKHQDAYLTFNQCKQLGGHVKKGAKAERVVFWKVDVKPSENLDEDGKHKLKTYAILKWYNVFWIGDTIGIKPPSDDELKELQTIKEPEDIIAGYVGAGGPKFFNQQISEGAFYRPSSDEVHVPMLGQFDDANEYYSTVFHELTHSTGHKSRLNREGVQGVAAFGSETYSKEELIAELGAAMLCNIGQVETKETFKNSAAYLQNWLTALKNDKTLIVSAAGKAQKAVDWILGKRGEQNEVPVRA